MMESNSPRNERKDKKNFILKKSMGIFAKKGFDKATIRQIAAASKVAVGTIYIYFKNKEEILHELFKREIDEHFEALFKKAYKLDETSAIELFYEDRFNLLSKNFKFVTIFLQEAQRNSKLSDMLYKKVFEKSFSYTRDFLSAKVEEGKFRRINVENTALAMLSIAVNIVLWKEGVFSKQLREKSYKTFTETISDLFIRGLLNPDRKQDADQREDKNTDEFPKKIRTKSNVKAGFKNEN